VHTCVHACIHALVRSCPHALSSTHLANEVFALLLRQEALEQEGARGPGQVHQLAPPLLLSRFRGCEGGAWVLCRVLHVQGQPECQRGPGGAPSAPHTQRAARLPLRAWAAQQRAPPAATGPPALAAVDVPFLQQAPRSRAHTTKEPLTKEDGSARPRPNSPLQPLAGAVVAAQVTERNEQSRSGSQPTQTQLSSQFVHMCAMYRQPHIFFLIPPLIILQ